MISKRYRILSSKAVVSTVLLSTSAHWISDLLVVMITGPVFQKKGNWIKDTVKIPSHNFMILKVEVESELMMKAFLVPHNMEGCEDLEPCLVSVDDIERWSGM
jgi:DNA/RNA endonuclease G (NUC1)